MIKKRVLIGSFILIIAGLFFIVGTDTEITGAAVGISTSALNSASNPLFGFFLIWIACFMLIANTTSLDKIIKSEEKAQKFARKDQVYETFQDYDTKVKSYLKKPSDLNSEEVEKVFEYVEQGRRKRWIKEFLGQATLDLYESGDGDFREEYRTLYDARTGLDHKKRLEIYNKTIQEGGEGIEAEVKISRQELAGIAKTGKQIAFNQVTPQDIEGIVGQVNREIGANYRPQDYKSIPKLAGMIEEYKIEKGIKKEREQREQSDRSPPGN